MITSFKTFSITGLIIIRFVITFVVTIRITVIRYSETLSKTDFRPVYNFNKGSTDHPLRVFLYVYNYADGPSGTWIPDFNSAPYLLINCPSILM